MPITETDYLYSSARIKSMEQRMLDAKRAEKLIEAQQGEETAKLLSELGYKADAADVETDRFYEKLISLQSAYVTGEIRTMAPDFSLFDCLFMQTDYHNLKVALKNELSGKNEQLYLEGGLVDVGELKREVAERSFSRLNGHMAAAVLEASEAVGESGDFSDIDYIVDRHCIADMRRSAKESGSALLERYVESLIDTVNISAYFRLRRIGRPAFEAEKAFYEGGSIAAGEYLANYDKRAEEFAEKNKFGAGALIAKGAQMFEENAAEFEIVLDDYLMSVAAGAKYVAFGSDVVAGYLIGKQREYKNLRIILAGKAAGLDAESISSRLRRFYV